eukprot:TRINITY_DN62110_c0_g1_i1.p3 TRINITY_DN62110_c0_g1~~TRINITY_DN62110_c0_g1_i1.p3  ORF type:complete len:103 (+),score=13.37 TRINITY_DN62110_c0_g1_i1:1016-1324(+)
MQLSIAALAPLSVTAGSKGCFAVREIRHEGRRYNKFYYHIIHGGKEILRTARERSSEVAWFDPAKQLPDGGTTGLVWEELDLHTPEILVLYQEVATERPAVR